MKKFLYILSILFLFNFTACNIGMPKSINIKTKADYNFTIADAEYDLNEKMDGLFDSVVQDGTDYKIYKYRPNGASLKKQMLIAMPLKSIPLDFNEYLQEMDFNQENMSVDPLVINVPSIDIGDTNAIDIANVKEIINGAISFRGSVTAAVSGINFIVGETGNSFGKVVYSEGGILIESAQPDDITVTLKFANEKTSTGTFKERTAFIPFTSDCNAITQTGMEITFGADCDTTKSFTGTIDSSSKISTVTGFTYTEAASETIPQQTFTIELPENVANLKIGEGSLNMTLNLPAGWSGVTSELTGNFDGVIDKDLDTSGKIDLEGQNIIPGDLKFTGTLKLNFNNSNLTFDNDEKPAFDYKVDIESLAEVTVKLKEGEFNPIQKTEQELSPDVYSTVKSIDWKKAGVSVQIKENNFPESNEIKIKSASSTFFNYNYEYAADPNASPLSATAKEYCAEDTTSTITDGVKADFTFEIEAFSYDTANNTVTLKDLEINKEYKLQIEVVPVFEWSKVVVDSGKLAEEQSGAISTGFDMGSMFYPMDMMIFGEKEGDFGVPNDNLLKKIGFTSVPMYLYCGVPECLSDLKFEGTIVANLVDSEGPVEDTDIFILGEKDSDGNLVNKELDSSNTKFDLLFDEKGSVVTDVSSVKNKTELKELLNSGKSGALNVNYNIKVAGSSGDLTIVNSKYKDSADSSANVLDPEGTTSIDLFVYVPIAFDFTANQAVTLPMSDLLGQEPDSDLLGRSEPMDMASMQDYLSVIQSVDITYKSSIVPLVKTDGASIGFEVALIDGKTNEYVLGKSSKGVKLNFDEGTLSLEPLGVMQAYPLKTELNLLIPQGNFYIADDMKIKANIALGIHTDGTIPLAALKETE